MSRFICLTLALYGLGSAQNNTDFGDPNYRNVSYPSIGPWGVFQPAFNEFLDNPNATTTFRIPSPPINASYPDADPDEGWSWTISVRDDIPAADWAGQEYTTNITAPKVFTGTRIRLNAPPALALPAPDNSTSSTNITTRAAAHNFTDWAVCIQKYEYSIHSSAQHVAIPDAWRHDDGSCSSMLSAECIRDWEALAVKTYKPGSCDGIWQRDIPSCQKAELIPKLYPNFQPGPFNATTVGNWSGGHFDFISYGGELHDRGNITAYNKTGSIPWPVIVVFGGWAIPGPYSPPGSGGQINTTAKLMCVRAMNATEGSVVPGSAFRTHATSALLWTSLGLTLLMAWL